MNVQNRQYNIDDEWQRAKNCLAAAHVLLAQLMLEDAMSRAYYAAFHATQAVLLCEGLEPKSHHGLMHLFGRHFVKTGRIEPQYSQILARAAKYREEADYRHTMIFTADHTTQTVQEVEAFIQRIQQFLQSAGFSVQ